MRFIKKSRYAFFRNPWNMTKRDNERLSVIQQKNGRLYRAYLLEVQMSRAAASRFERSAAGFAKFSAGIEVFPFFSSNGRRLFV